MTDKELYKYCQDVGGKAREWKKRFVALLPEVAKRNLHRKYGFASIVDFAGRIGGVGEYTVQIALQVQKHINDKPALLNVLPQVGVHKMRVVARIATKENQEFLAKKVTEMSKGALEIWTREILPRQKNGDITTVQNALFNGQNNLFGSSGEFENFSNMSMVDEHIHYSFDVDKETDFKLRKCKQEMEKAMKRYATWCEVMQNLIINKGENKMGNLMNDNKNLSKNDIANNNKQTLDAVKPISKPVTSRYIPSLIKKELDTVYGGKCGYPGCNKPAEEMHHTKRFALNPSHENIVPLCSNHHEIAHNGLIKNEDLSPQKWLTEAYIDYQKTAKELKEKIDQKVRLYSMRLKSPNTS